MNSNNEITKLTRTIARADGSELRISVQAMFGSGLHRSLEVGVWYRGDTASAWGLLSTRPHQRGGHPGDQRPEAPELDETLFNSVCDDVLRSLDGLELTVIDYGVEVVLPRTRADGSAVRVAGMQRNRAVEVWTRAADHEPWRLCSNEKAAGWQAMSVDEYVSSGRSEALMAARPGEMLRVAAAIL